jgi:hypothetical protein
MDDIARLVRNCTLFKCLLPLRRSVFVTGGRALIIRAATENVRGGERTLFANRHIILILTILTLSYNLQKEGESCNVLHKKYFPLIVSVLCLHLLLLYNNSAG